MWRALYLRDRFFLAFGLQACLFVLGFAVPVVYPFALASLAFLLALLALDAWFLFRYPLPIRCRRTLPQVFNLGDPNKVQLQVGNASARPIWLNVVDEPPAMMPLKEKSFELFLPPGAEKTLTYTLTPTRRGRFGFGQVNVFAHTSIGLLERRQRAGEAVEVAVYPSILQMKKLALRAFPRIAHQQGIKKMRRIGHSYEFEQIKSYVRGDDYRSINWKASSRRASLMVNQYEDERAQQIYCVIDKSRSMRMPFQGLSLMDHAINASLVISNIALQKHDRAGLITFSDKVGATLKADSRPTQLRKILEALYRERERPLEANFELLYYLTRKLIHGRSLLLLFTNFESLYALERTIGLLRRINRSHLLVVVFFENVDIRQEAEASVATPEGVYRQTIARKFLQEKTQMVQRLRQYGIQAILTSPQDLSVNTVNKYLELKSRGLI